MTQRKKTIYQAGEKPVVEYVDDKKSDKKEPVKPQPKKDVNAGKP